jgi:methionine aminopeptidase
LDEKETTVYKRALDKQYNLKMKTSRALFSEINKRFPTMPFTARSLEEVRGLNLGLVECLNHELLHSYPVLHVKEDEVLAHYKATVLLMPNGSDRVTLFESQPLKSEKAVQDEEVIALLASSVKKKKGKKAAKAASSAAEQTA